MRHLAFGRILVLVLALAAVAAAVKFGIDAKRWHNDFYRWVDARPMDTELVLSEPGTYTVPFTQTCGISHGEGIYLDIEPTDGSWEETVEALEGLAGTITIRDTQGQEVESAQFGPDTIRVWRDQEGFDRIVLTGIYTFPPGDYTATIQINSGAEGFSSEPQRVYARYALCGLELMPATIMFVLAVVAGLFAFVCICCILPGLYRHGLWRSQPPGPPPTSY